MASSTEDLKRERARLYAEIARLRKGRVTESERAAIRKKRMRIEAIDKQLQADPADLKRSRPKDPKGTHDDKYEGVPITAKNARDMYIHYRRKVGTATIFTKDRAYFERRLGVARDVIRKAGQKLPPPEPLFGKKKGKKAQPYKKAPPSKDPYKKAPPSRDPYRSAPPPPRGTFAPGVSKLPIEQIRKMRAEAQRKAEQARARQDWAALQRAEAIVGRLTQAWNAKTMAEDSQAQMMPADAQSEVAVTDTDVETEASAEAEPWYKRYGLWLLGGAAAVGLGYAATKGKKGGGGISFIGGVPTRKGKRVRIVRPK